ncbi:Cthe_2314 family HEPN domain-containing protein [Bacillus pacificus]|uniref:Cthe_2314 family HEPN domain-containing protein n=1 Tax=Bacillus pacificus TaxID=2026187 RepID=UPI0011238FBB|nr:Cthe_2314 family HEPN domain-containing protein [Bacillus pacificus]TNP01508.1 hypothetical protein FHY68_22340 [Bacillus pacificus]
MEDYLTLNVDEKLLIEESAKLNPFPDCFILNELEEFFYNNNQEIAKKLLRIKEWIFSLQVNNKELCTCIIYGNIWCKKDAENFSLENFNINQQFYKEHASFFSNHAISLAFSLGDKVAQLVNIASNLNLKDKNISLHKILDCTNPILKAYETDLKKLKEMRDKIKDARHMKIHNYESDLQKTNIDINAGKINNRPAQIAIYGLARIPTTPNQKLKKCSEFHSVFIEVINNILKVICNSLKVGFEDELHEIGVMKTAMGIKSKLI